MRDELHRFVRLYAISYRKKLGKVVFTADDVADMITDCMEQIANEVDLTRDDLLEVYAEFRGGNEDGERAEDAS